MSSTDILIAKCASLSRELEKTREASCEMYLRISEANAKLEAVRELFFEGSFIERYDEIKMAQVEAWAISEPDANKLFLLLNEGSGDETPSSP